MGVFLFIELSRTVDFARQRTGASQPSEPPSNETEIPASGTENDVFNLFSHDKGDLRLLDLAGNPVELADFSGKAVMLNFWATWCPPCLDEMPLIDEFARKHADELAVVAINAGENQSVVREFIDQHDFIFDILLNPTNTAANRFFIYAYPTTMFFDQFGDIQSTHIGELNEALIINYLTRIGIDQ